MWNVDDVICWDCEMLGLWDIRDVRCWECGMLGMGLFGMWDVGDVECSGCGMFGMRDVHDVGCGMWDVGCLPGCRMLIYKMPFNSTHDS